MKSFCVATLLLLVSLPVQGQDRAALITITEEIKEILDSVPGHGTWIAVDPHVRFPLVGDSVWGTSRSNEILAPLLKLGEVRIIPTGVAAVCADTKPCGVDGFPRAYVAIGEFIDQADGRLGVNVQVSVRQAENPKAYHAYTGDQYTLFLRRTDEGWVVEERLAGYRLKRP